MSLRTATESDKGEDDARSRLYAGAALVVSDNAGKGVETLQAIDRSRLSAADAELQDAALAVAASVRAEPKTATTPPAGEPGSTAIVDRAQAIVADADRLLGRAQP